MCYVQYGTAQCYPKLHSSFGVLLGKSLLVTLWRKAVMWSTQQAVTHTQIPWKSITDSGLLGKSLNCNMLLLQPFVLLHCPGTPDAPLQAGCMLLFIHSFMNCSCAISELAYHCFIIIVRLECESTLSPVSASTYASKTSDTYTCNVKLWRTRLACGWMFAGCNADSRHRHAVRHLLALLAWILYCMNTQLQVTATSRGSNDY